MSRILQDGSVQTTGKEERQARRELSARGAKVMNIFDQFEQFAMIDPAQICALANAPMIHLIGFSCLGTYRGRQELIPDLMQTYFFRSRKTVRRVHELADALRATGINVSIEIFLPDLEPRRTWGWEASQDELTFYCKCMREEVELSEGWRVTLWSELEAELLESVRFDDWVAWAQEHNPLLIAQVAEHLRQFDMIEFPQGVVWSASRQVAAYAMEGALLEQARSDSVFLQSESPHDHKDRLYQPRRTRPLPIIHPFL
ncbi:MAG: hypothetical protein ABIA83_01280 [Patescibacteria group bacterium]